MPTFIGVPGTLGATGDTLMIGIVTVPGAEIG